MTNIPTGWFEEPLNKFVDARSGNGKLIKGKQSVTKSEGLFPAFSASGQDIWTEKAEVTGPGIVVSAVGARCGKSFLAEGNWTAVANTHIMQIKKDAQLDIKYLWYLCNDEHWWIRSGTAQPFVKVKDTLERPQLLPPIHEQHKIVELLEDHLSRLDAALADVKRAKLQAAQFHKSFIHNMTTSVESSEVMNILEICDVYQPKTISTKELIPDGAFPVYGANGQIGFYDKFNHEESEVTVTCRGATCGTVNVIPAMSWITGNAMVFTPKDSRIQKGYLEYALKGMDWTPVITGTAQPQITRTSIKDVFVDVPSPEIQHEIYMKLESALTQVSRASLLIELIEAQGASLRRSLLQAAFTGQLTKEVSSV